MRQLRSFIEIAAKEIENGGYKILLTIDQKIHFLPCNAVSDYMALF